MCYVLPENLRGIIVALLLLGYEAQVFLIKFVPGYLKVYFPCKHHIF